MVCALVPGLAVPGVASVVGVAVGQADHHLVLVDVVLGVGQPGVPHLGAVIPHAGSADVVEVVQGVARPGPRDGGDEGPLGLLLGGAGGGSVVGEVGQGAGGHQGARVAQVAVVDELLRPLAHAEDGDVGLVFALEVLVVVGPLEPLDGVLEASHASRGEGRGQRTGGHPLGRSLGRLGYVGQDRRGGDGRTDRERDREA